MTQIRDTKLEMVLVEQSTNKLVVKKGQVLNDQIIKERLRLLKRSIVILICVVAIVSVIGLQFFDILRLWVILSGILLISGVNLLIKFLELFEPCYENWTFDKFSGELVQTISSCLKTKVIYYPLTDIVNVEIRAQTDDSFIAYEILLIRQSKKAISLGCSPYNINSNQQAIAHKKQQEIAKAIYEFLRPNHPNPFLNNPNSDEDIFEEFKQQIDIESIFKELKDLLVLKYANQKKRQQIISQLQAEIRNNPEDPQAYKKLGWALIIINQKLEAIAILKQARNLFIYEENTEESEKITQIIEKMER